MTMFLGDPDLELRLYGERYQQNYNSYIDDNGNEYEYDEFIGKWLKKRKEKRASNPKVIARRQKRDEKRIEKGKDPKHPELIRTAPTTKAPVKKTTTAPASKTTSASTSEIKPLTKSEAQAHKNVNKAIQEELKTKQEELKTLGLEKQVAQEDLKAENQKAKTQLASTGKGLLWVVAIVGGIVVLKTVFGSKPEGQPQGAAIPVTK